MPLHDELLLFALLLAPLARGQRGTAETQKAAQVAAQSRGYRLVDAFPAQKDFELPLYLDHDPSDPDHVYVVEQGGMIWRIPSDGKQEGREEFLSWKGRCLRGNQEEGLLGFAFDPDYERNGFFYIYYSQKVPKKEGGSGRRSVISRLHKVEGIAGPLADPDSELSLLTVPQPHGNHNGGTLVFGPDKMLYIALGDGGAANDPHGNGQNRHTLLASVLRIDVRGATAERPYRIPDDNPFAHDPDRAVRREIWAHGLRNPWRLTFDAASGDLWCGDVGQNSFEEVDRIVKGGNYGWNFREGRHAFAGGFRHAHEPKNLIEPVAEYGRELGISVTGGYVYRGKELPELVGWYVYGDFATGRIQAVREDRAHGKHVVRELLRSGKSISSFAQTKERELLVLSFDGRIYALRRGDG